MKKDHKFRKIYPLRKGRNWIDCGDGWSDKVDGWWFLPGYWLWVPDLKYLLTGIYLRVVDGNTNPFYTKDKRDRWGVTIQ